ncbi:MAG: hypothetical protein ACUVX8_03425 [Candidatus Zipacnadales bacterium]
MSERGTQPTHARKRRKGLSPVAICFYYYCVLGLALLGADLAHWAQTGVYTTPTLLGVLLIKWLALPGIALAGGAAMVAASARHRWWWAAFIGSLLMLGIYAYAWMISDFLVDNPEWYLG